MAKRKGPSIGQYRHSPGSYISGPDGAIRSIKTRRRFPHLFLVFIAGALLTPLVCAGVALLFNLPLLKGLAPKRYGDALLPPSPTVENVLFGAGAHELAVAGAIVALLLWRHLWRIRLPDPLRNARFWDSLPQVLGPALALGPAYALLAMPIACIGLFIRTGPAQIPWAAKPFFALLSVPVLTLNIISTGIVPLMLVFLGLGFGALTAIGVAYGWQSYPEEADTKA